MALALSTLHAAISTSIETLLGPSGWTESRVPYPYFPGQPGQLAHLSYSVGCIASRPVARDHQTPFGSVVQSEIGVIFSHRLKADNSVPDYRACLDAEAALLLAVMATDPSAGVSPVFAGVPSRQTAGDGTFYIGELRFRFLHTMAVV